MLKERWLLVFLAITLSSCIIGIKGRRGWPNRTPESDSSDNDWLSQDIPSSGDSLRNFIHSAYVANQEREDTEKAELETKIKRLKRPKPTTSPKPAYQPYQPQYTSSDTVALKHEPLSLDTSTAQLQLQPESPNQYPAGPQVSYSQITTQYLSNLHSPNQNPNYPPSQNPAYPPDQNPGYPSSQNPAYPPDQNPSYPSIQNPVYPPSQIPVHPPGQNPSYLPNQNPAYPSGQNPAYPPNQNPVYPPSQYPAYPPTQNPSYPNYQPYNPSQNQVIPPNQNTVIPSNQNPIPLPNQNPIYPPNQNPIFPNVNPNQITGCGIIICQLPCHSQQQALPAAQPPSQPQTQAQIIHALTGTIVEAQLKPPHDQNQPPKVINSVPPTSQTWSGPPPDWGKEIQVGKGKPIKPDDSALRQVRQN